MHVDPVLFGGLALVLVLAKAVGDLFERLGQPAVLGEILAGVLLGNLGLTGWHGLDFLLHDPTFAGLAEIGVILLLFQVGLESDLYKMAKTGPAATLVAIIGVVVPMVMGYGVHAYLDPQQSWHVHLFVGAVLAATSVGITARVLRDMGRIDSPTARVILGAAVIDDVLGLVVLAVVAGIVEGANGGTALRVSDIARISLLAVGFLFGAMALGRPVSRGMFKVVSYLQIHGVLLAAALAFCFALSWAASLVGLHPIVGAFAAGLVLDQVAYRDLESREPHGLEVQLHPIAGFLIPVFFVATGAQVDLSTFTPSMLTLAGGLTLVAILGKQACSLAAFGPGVDRLSVGIGMIPRGEVGLIFANVGSTLMLAGQPVVSHATFAAAVLMVMATTLVTPPLLGWSLKRGER